MNTAHIHLTINHFPVFAVLFGLFVLLVGRTRRSAEVTSVALMTFVIAALATVPTYYTGKGSSRVIRGLPGVEREYTIAHAEAAQLALILCLILGALSLWALLQIQRSGDIAVGIRWSVWILAIVTAGMMFRTSHLGGQIRHTETRPDYVLPTEDPSGGPGGPGGEAPGTEGQGGAPAP